MSAVAFIYELLEQGKVLVERTWETDLLDTASFGELFQKIAPAHMRDRPVTVSMGFKQPHKEPTQFIKVKVTQTLQLLNLQGSNFVRFQVQPSSKDATEELNVFSKMMNSARAKVLPQNRSVNNKKDELYNNILSVLQDHDLGFPTGTENTTGANFVTYLRNLIWYLDPHWKNLKDSVSMAVPDSVMLIYKKNCLDDMIPYNDYQAKKIEKPRLSQEEITKFIFTGSEYLQTVWFNKPKWNFLKKGLSELIEGMNKYANHLKQKSTSVSALHKSMKPARTPFEDAECYTLDGSDIVCNDNFKFLHDALLQKDFYEPLFLNDFGEISKMNKFDRYVFFKKLRNEGISLPVVHFKYSPKSGIHTYHFMWKLPEISLRDDSMYIRLSSQIAKSIPVYHTRAMRAEFKEHFESICTLKPAIVRAMYKYLTGDESASSSKTSKAVDDRVQLALESEDPDLVFDLRELGTGKAGKYDAFWDALHKVLERDFPPATEERRHGEGLYSPVAISIRDLIAKVKEVDPDAPVPSESWILLQFTPKDPRRHASLNYTSRFNIVYKIQSRSHHTKHEDTYYCMSLFKILRSFAVRYCDYTSFYCEDDKHGVNIGEPENPLSSLLRGRKVMVLKDNEPTASDHDWHRFKATPSVLLKCNVPTTIEESFYSGQIYVTVKNAIFEKSSALRHTAERSAIYENDETRDPIECMYPDGGPDHNPVHYSVRIAHIAHFLKYDLDMLAAACTYPGGSYVDPAERCMPLLNIALNGVALSRTSMGEHHEKTLKNCKSMEEIRKKCEGDEELTSAVIESSRSAIDLMNSRFQSVSLKGKPLIVGEPASAQEIDEIFENLSIVDSDLGISETTKEGVEKHPTFMSWFKAHTRCRRYMFQIRKCAKSPASERWKEECAEDVKLSSLDITVKDELLDIIDTCRLTSNLMKISKSVESGSCDIAALKREAELPIEPCSSCKPPRLPLKLFTGLFWVPDPTPTKEDDTKFQHFDDLYGTDTAEIYRPSYQENLDVNHKDLLVKERVSALIKCGSCLKPRIVYAAKKTVKNNSNTITLHIETIQYVCGMSLFPPGHELEDLVITRRMIKCSSPVEIPYYSSGKYEDVCFHCGLKRDFVDVPQKLQAEFRKVYSLCTVCESNKKKFFTRMPIRKRGSTTAGDVPKKKRK